MTGSGVGSWPPSLRALLPVGLSCSARGHSLEPVRIPGCRERPLWWSPLQPTPGTGRQQPGDPGQVGTALEPSGARE